MKTEKLKNRTNIITNAAVFGIAALILIGFLFFRSGIFTREPEVSVTPDNCYEEDRKKSIAAGMNDHVAKPININELVKVLEKYL